MQTSLLWGNPSQSIVDADRGKTGSTTAGTAHTTRQGRMFIVRDSDPSDFSKDRTSLFSQLVWCKNSTGSTVAPMDPIRWLAGTLLFTEIGSVCTTGQEVHGIVDDRIPSGTTVASGDYCWVVIGGPVLLKSDGVTSLTSGMNLAVKSSSRFGTLSSAASTVTTAAEIVARAAVVLGSGTVVGVADTTFLALLR